MNDSPTNDRTMKVATAFIWGIIVGVGIMILIDLASWSPVYYGH